MKYFCALTVILGLVTVAPASAQFRMRTGALGGSVGARASSRPLGGFGPSYNSFGSGRYYRGSASRAPLYGYSYGYPFWAPDYFDYGDQSQYGAAYGPPPDASYYAAPPALAAAPQQPVIINQYFGIPGPAQSNGPEIGNTSAQAPGDPIGDPQNYYLIAYKNHAIYSALAYWVEDKTLHYVTTQNTHNQASLDLIDLDLTKSLNQRNDVPFAIPGH